MVDIFNQILAYVPYVSLASFIAGLLSEDILLFFVILASAGKINIWVVFLFGFIGIVFHDTIVYFLSKFRVISEIKKKMNGLPFLSRLENKRYLVPLTISKFVYETRLAAVLYVAN